MTHWFTVGRVTIMVHPWSLQLEPLSSLVKCNHRPKFLAAGESISNVDICQVCSIETLHLENEFNKNTCKFRNLKNVLWLKYM